MKRRLVLVLLGFAALAGTACVRVCEPVDATNPSDYRSPCDPERECVDLTVFDVVGGLQQQGAFDGR